MGPWASIIIAVAAIAAVVIATLSFRGLVESLERMTNTCGHCGRTALWPLPITRHECRRCRHADHAHARLPRLRHQ